MVCSGEPNRSPVRPRPRSTKRSSCLGRRRHSARSRAPQEAEAMKIESSAFGPGAEIPPIYTCEGEDISPPLRFADLPPGTKSLALIVDDPDAPDPAAPRMTWVHWVLYDMPPTTYGLPESVKTLPAGTK